MNDATLPVEEGRVVPSHGTEEGVPGEGFLCIEIDRAERPVANPGHPRSPAGRKAPPRLRLRRAAADGAQAYAVAVFACELEGKAREVSSRCDGAGVCAFDITQHCFRCGSP